MPAIYTQKDLFNNVLGFPVGVLKPLRAHISGPQAKLHRYAVSGEKTAISLGAYNPDVEGTHSYPGKQANAIVDQDYVKLYMDGARIRYFQDLIGSGDTIIPVASYRNRIRVSSGSTVWKANGTTYPRSSNLEADVKVGDEVYIRGVVSATNVELTSYVKDFVAEVVAATTGAAAADASNKATQSASSSQSQTAGTVTCVVISTLSHTNYDGLKDGDISEVYTVECIQGSVSGNATTARLKVTSASGRDNQASITPAAFSSATSVGTRGLTATWVNTAGSCSGSDFVVGQKWVINVAQAYTALTGGTSAGTYTGTENTSYILEYSRGGALATVQAIPTPTTAPTTSTAATGGTIPDNTYYIAYTYVGGTAGETMVSAESTRVTAGGDLSTVTVTSPAAQNGSTQYNVYMGTVSGTLKKQGGATNIGTNVTLTSFNAGGAAPPASNNATGLQPNTTPPQITVSTTTGVDLSGPTSLVPTGSGVTWSAPSISIGTKGVTWTTNGSSYAKGDKFSIAVTAVANGSYKTIILAHDMPTSPQDLATATDLDVKIFAKQDGLLISKNRTESAPNVNYVVSSSNFVTKTGITATDARWTAGTKYPVISGTMYLEYREWIPDNSALVGKLSAASGVEAALGTVHPDNPLAYGVYKALQNSNGQEVAYTSVADPSSASSWQDTLNIIDSVENVFGLVPLTNDTAIHTKFKDFVGTQSGAEVGVYKRLWLPSIETTSKVVVNSTKTSDALHALATLKDDPDTSGTQYTYLAVPAGNAKFVTNGVVAGDKVRFLYTTDGFGATSYTEFTVGSVVNEDTLKLSTAHTVPINTAQRVEVWHNNTLDEIVTAQVAAATAYNNKRISVVGPDTWVDGSTSFASYFGCAILAGLTSAVPPHQGVRNVQLVGVTDVKRAASTTYYSNAQRNSLTAGGVWVVDKDPTATYIYSRAATTTSVAALDNREEMVVRNIDAVAYTLQKQLANYIGVANVVQSTLNRMVADMRSARTYLVQSTYIAKLGSMVTEMTITEVRAHTTLKDRVVINVEVTLPYPVNKIEIQVVV